MCNHQNCCLFTGLQFFHKIFISHFVHSPIQITIAFHLGRFYFNVDYYRITSSKFIYISATIIPAEYLMVSPVLVISLHIGFHGPEIDTERIRKKDAIIEKFSET